MASPGSTSLAGACSRTGALPAPATRRFPAMSARLPLGAKLKVAWFMVRPRFDLGVKPVSSVTSSHDELRQNRDHGQDRTFLSDRIADQAAGRRELRTAAVRAG